MQNTKPQLKKHESALNESTVLNLDTSTEEDMSSDNHETQTWEGELDGSMDTILKEEAQAWLAQHGQKLFALETSKYLARKDRVKAVTSKR